MNENKVSIGKLILWPAVITLAVTLLRLTGELLHWSPKLFSTQAGGGGSPIGISWLPPIFGILFAIQLVRAGRGPARAGRAAALGLAGMALTAILMFGAIKTGVVQENQFSLTALAVMTTALAAGALVASLGWPDLGRTLLAYALAARVPVAIVMLVAMMGDWKTHYDVAAPGVPEMGVMQKWLTIGALPQLTTWIAITVLMGALFGTIAGAIASRGRAANPVV